MPLLNPKYPAELYRGTSNTYKHANPCARGKACEICPYDPKPDHVHPDDHKHGEIVHFKICEHCDHFNRFSYHKVLHCDVQHRNVHHHDEDYGHGSKCDVCRTSLEHSGVVNIKFVPGDGTMIGVVKSRSRPHGKLA